MSAPGKINLAGIVVDYEPSAIEGDVGDPRVLALVEAVEAAKRYMSVTYIEAPRRQLDELQGALSVFSFEDSR